MLESGISRKDFAFVNSPHTTRAAERVRPFESDEVKLNHGSTTEKFMIARHIDFKIHEYLKKCQARGGLIQVIAEELRCTSSSPSEIERSFLPDSAWQLMCSDGGGLAIEVASTQSDDSINQKVANLIVDCRQCSVLVVRNLNWNHKGACIELWKPDTSQKNCLKHRLAWHKEYLSSDGELLTANETADIELADFLDDTFLQNLALIHTEAVRSCPKLRINLHQLGEEELRSREEKVSSAVLVKRMANRLISLSAFNENKGADEDNQTPPKEKRRRLGPVMRGSHS